MFNSIKKYYNEPLVQNILNIIVIKRFPKPAT